MKPRVWIMSVSWQESVMMPFWLRYYSTFAEKIIVWDEQSTDGTREMVKACPKAELRDWPFKGLDDDKFIWAVNTWYKEARVAVADWVMWPDIDEILYHPDPLKALADATASVIRAKGYAMISSDGPPDPASDKQIHELVKTGVPTDNYDKAIIWRPIVDILFTVGRHYQAKTLGPISNGFPFKLLHYHYFGVDYTASRNQRNFDRAVNKKYAWNYFPEFNKPTQKGTVAWVKNILATGQLKDVVSQ